jgi:histidyl-tRNA synthetase
MPTPLKAIRGMNDLLPETMPYWQLVEAACQKVARAYAYREVRMPIVESTALFKRTIGEETDIIGKEMYTFDDRNGESLSLRPEGTAGCVRMGIQQGLLYHQLQRFWYLGPMFRHEKPQKGRYRQFYQFGIEAFGFSQPDIDAEVIALSYRLWQELGLQDTIKLEINNLGSAQSRAQYRQVLVEYFTQHHADLDEDSQRRLTTNPLRILDSKNPKMQDMIRQAPTLIEHMDDDSKAHFEKLQVYLKALNIPYTINPHLVRGLDYYGLTVFEWVTDALGAQGTVCAGGRYDVLVEQLGGKSTPAVGFAMGLERIVLLLQDAQQHQFTPDIYCVLVGDAAVEKGLQVAECLRQQIPGIAVEMNASGGSMKSQFKRADKSQAKWAVIIGEDELTNNTITIKSLKEKSEQQTLSVEALVTMIQGENYD